MLRRTEVLTTPLGRASLGRVSAGLETVWLDRALAQLDEISRLTMRNRFLLADMMLRPVPAVIEKHTVKMATNIKAIGDELKQYLATKLTPEEKQRAERLVAARWSPVTPGAAASVRATGNAGRWERF